ncbi:MAG: YihY/virulence factor BrkB family protein [Alphaproteobacteria bacterium]|nr:YihY/virulence factor BrkB family protein [Alphaproteobacteria bacterium]
MRTLRDIWGCTRRAAVLTVYHDGIEHAGYLAFLGLLSLFPFLVLLVAVAGWLGQGNAGAQFISTLLEGLPQHVVGALTPRIEEIISGPPQGLVTIAIVGALWTASSAVEGIRTVLNRAYHVATPPAYIWRRSLSVLQLLVFTFVLIVCMLFVVFVPIFLQHVETFLGTKFLATHEILVNNLLFWLMPCVLFLSVSAIYYVIPNIKLRFLSVMPGALTVVVGWLLAAHLLTIYLLDFEQVNLIYGSLGGIIAALLFFYICNIVFIFGAELNYQLTQMRS